MAIFRERNGDGIITTTSIGEDTFTLKGSGSVMALGAAEIFAKRHGLERDAMAVAYRIPNRVVHGRVLVDLHANRYFQEVGLPR